MSTDESSNDLRKSAIHNFGVMVLNPYLFSILNVPYKSKGISRTVLAALKSRKNNRPDGMKSRLSSATQELYIFRIPPKINTTVTMLPKIDEIKPNRVFSASYSWILFRRCSSM